MIKKIIQIVKNHKWAIFLAFAAAAIIAYPQLFLRYDLGGNYQGIEIMGAPDDEQNWLPRVREVQDGYPAFSCAFFKEGKDDPYLLQPLGTIMFASLGSIFSLDINNTLLLSRFFFSFVVFLIIYAFIFFLSRDRLTALAITSIFFLARDIFSLGAVEKIMALASPSTKYLNLMRPVNPLMTYFFFFGFLVIFWLFLDRKQWRYGFLSAIMLGLSFYDYFYTWTFLYAFCGLLIIIFFLQKNRQKLKGVCAVLLGSFLIGIPYLINLYQVTLHPNYQEHAQKAALLGTRDLTLGLLVPVLFIAFLLFFPRKWKERYFFVLALVLTPFIVLNQQLVTGKVLLNVHYHWYFNKPLAIIFLLMIFFSWLPLIKWRFLGKVLAVSAIIFSVFCGIWVQGSSYAAHKEIISHEQRYGPVMDWLSQNAEKDEVVFSNEDIAHSLIIYTPLNPFDHSTGCLSVSSERILNALFLYYKLDGVGEDDALEVFLRDRKTISMRLYGLYYRETTGDYSGIPDEIIQEIVQKYRASFSVSKVDFIRNLWDRYEVKYLVWDKTENPKWQLGQHPFLKKVFISGDLEIYQYDEQY